MPNAVRCLRSFAAAPLRAALLGVAVSARLAGAQLADSTLLARGDSAWAAGNASVAEEAYRAVVAADSAAAPRAVFRLATLLARARSFPEATRLFRLYRALSPGDVEGPIGLARTFAWSGRLDESVALFDTVVAADSSARDAVLGGAQALAWGARRSEAIRRYERWLATHPSDREAQMGLARVTAWDGDLRRSERLWRDLTTRFPDDADAWTGLAQVVRWRGDPAAARRVLEAALAADANHEEARAQLAAIDAELASAIEPTVITSADRDRNASVIATVTASLAPEFGGRVAIGLSRREASLGGAGGTTLVRGSSTAVRAAASHDFGARWTVHAAAGATHLAPRAGDAQSPSPARRPLTIGTWNAGLRGDITRMSSVGVDVSRSAFDETATLIAHGLAVQSLEGSGRLALPARVTVSVNAARASVEGGSVPNDRRSGGAAATWRAASRLALGISARGEGYRRDGRRDGYFSPARLALVELTTAWTAGAPRGWWWTVEGGAGQQTIRFQSLAPGARGALSRKPAERLTLGAGYRFGRGVELGASAGAANSASAAAIGVAGYRAYTVAVRGRLTL